MKSNFYGVSVSGDTVKFKTDYFKDGTEETAGELLNKIPDMEVSENGNVSYAGKPVDKVLMDGKDVFSSGSGDCPEMEHCPTVAVVHSYKPEARENLTHLL